MTVKELTKEQDTLRNEIDALADKEGLWTEDVGPIRDGVADIEAYLHSSPKIMWVLKEPYDDFKKDGSPYGGDYTLLEDLIKHRDLPLQQTLPPTDRRVIYATYGIYTGYQYDEMKHYKDPDVYKYLFQIAYINLSKMPAGKRSGNMMSKYLVWRDVVLKQIRLFKPDVIIFGGTFQYLKDDLEIADSSLIHSEAGWKLNIFRQDNTLFIDTYHSGIPGWDRMYVNTIVNNIRQYFKS